MTKGKEIIDMYFYIILVIYNQEVKTLCFNRLQRIPTLNASLIVVDNSTDKVIVEQNKETCLNNQFQYICMNGNFGLPKAYNSAIQTIPKDKNSWIIILDQDTEIDINFFNCYQKAIKNNPQKQIFCPVIKDSEGIMSPSRIKGIKFVHSELMDYNEQIKNYSFINSCMCINSTVFNSVQYDENLFLDYVDHDFVKMIRKKYNDDFFYIIHDIEIFQNFSGVTKNTFSADYNRFKIYKKDLKYFTSKWYGKKCIANKMLFLRAIKLAIQHNKIDFIKEVFVSVIGDRNR